MACLTDHDLHRLHDDELSPADRMRVAAHVASCDVCAERLHEIASIGDLLRNAPLPGMARDAMVRIQRNVAAMQERSVRRLAGWMTAAASIVLVVSLYAATSSQAHATPSVTEWEAAAIGVDVESTSTDQATAQWIVADLVQIPADSPKQRGQQ